MFVVVIISLSMLCLQQSRPASVPEQPSWTARLKNRSRSLSSASPRRLLPESRRLFPSLLLVRHTRSTPPLLSSSSSSPSFPPSRPPFLLLLLTIHWRPVFVPHRRVVPLLLLEDLHQLPFTHSVYIYSAAAATQREKDCSIFDCCFPQMLHFSPTSLSY